MNTAPPESAKEPGVPAGAPAAFDIPAFLKSLPHRPGIYRMLDTRGEVLYVGKAKSLKKRVSSYFLQRDAPPKQRALVGRIHSIEVTLTRTEGEALLLESQLIKRHKPRYNISLRDDKSYPYIHLSTQQDFPRLSFYRGARRKLGRNFGPYPGATAVRESLKLLQKVFQVRQCEDSVFSNRSRPCLQYQIDRCTAPCVGLIDAERYRQDVGLTLLFLDGRSAQVIDNLAHRMEQASAALEFENAARYRDQIAALRAILQKQTVEGEKGDVDLLACASQGGLACVQAVFIRSGQNLGDRAYFPKMEGENEPAQVIGAFIGQFYLEKSPPPEILVSHEPEDAALLVEVLSRQAGHAVRIVSRVRGERLRWLEMARTNAANALRGQIAGRMSLQLRFTSLMEALGLSDEPSRLECFDISHTQGSGTVASCVVFDREGPVKSAYRRFNIEGITPGDDYAAIGQAVQRRFRRTGKGEQPCPDLLFIDGGKGQVEAARQALVECGFEDVKIVGVAKGPARKPGMEELILPDAAAPLILPAASPALLLIQQIRDEAHRFAITGHRQRRAKANRQSPLDDIPGLGPKRRQQLLRQFGGLREIGRASVEALAAIDGISPELARRIYETFHEA